MPSPKLPLELLLMIADQLTDDNRERSFGDFNSFSQVNHALYSCLNPILWKEAAENDDAASRLFAQLIRTNNVSHLKYFLQFGPCTENRLTFRTNVIFESPTPLIAAFYMDNVPMARLLLRSGADVETTDANSNTPLHCASWRGNLDAVKLLVKRWPQGVRALNLYLETPLHLAVRAGNREVIRFLLKLHPQAVRMRNDVGATILHLAAMVGVVEVVRILVKSWPEGKRKMDSGGRTPYGIFVRHHLKDGKLPDGIPELLSNKDLINSR
jgi:hypothetical protein